MPRKWNRPSFSSPVLEAVTPSRVPIAPIAPIAPMAIIAVIALAGLAASTAAPAQAEVFHVKLRNGTTIDTLYQPQQATWDPNVVILLSDAGNWIGVDQKDIDSVVSESQIRGFGVALNFNTIAIGWAPNDAVDPATIQANPQAATLQALQNIYRQQQEQQHYTIPQFVSTEQTAGIPPRLVGGAVLPGVPGAPSTLPAPLPAPAAPAPPPNGTNQ
ncbi:MAG: hypothetical protein JOZ15_20685 [Acidobacteria bacterium]|nr:hypothetical protein [Acidobacteriota bacterium]